MKTLGLIIVFSLLAGCQRPSAMVSAQKPGGSSGAGAVFQGPTNAAAPSEHTAMRTTVYQPQPSVRVTEPVPVVRPALPASSDQVMGEGPPVPSAPAGFFPPPVPAYVVESTSTRLGEHQDAAGIMKVAAAAQKWTWLRWVGIVCVILGTAGWLWSIGNPNGFILVFVGVAACGIVFIFASANPAWLLVLALPAAWFALQHMNLIKLP